jgi:hypothetical protein
MKEVFERGFHSIPRFTKEQTLAAITEVGGMGKKASCSALKKDALAKTAEKELKGKGWLPAILR